MPNIKAYDASRKVLLVGGDGNKPLERRLRAVGCQVVCVNDNESARDHVRHETFDTIVLVSRGSFINVVETLFNLRDLNQSMEIIVLVDRSHKHPSRFLRQLLQHPIEGTQVLTRRQLQKQMRAGATTTPSGAAVEAR